MRQSGGPDIRTVTLCTAAVTANKTARIKTKILPNKGENLKLTCGIIPSPLFRAPEEIPRVAGQGEAQGESEVRVPKDPLPVHPQDCKEDG